MQHYKMLLSSIKANPGHFAPVVYSFLGLLQNGFDFVKWHSLVKLLKNISVISEHPLVPSRGTSWYSHVSKKRIPERRAEHSALIHTIFYRHFFRELALDTDLAMAGQQVCIKEVKYIRAYSVSLQPGDQVRFENSTEGSTDILEEGTALPASTEQCQTARQCVIEWFSINGCQGKITWRLSDATELADGTSGQPAASSSSHSSHYT